jgi:hypothetical protein
MCPCCQATRYPYQLTDQLVPRAAWRGAAEAGALVRGVQIKAAQKKAKKGADVEEPPASAQEVGFACSPHGPHGLCRSHGPHGLHGLNCPAGVWRGRSVAAPGGGHGSPGAGQAGGCGAAAERGPVRCVLRALRMLGTLLHVLCALGTLPRVLRVLGGAAACRKQTVRHSIGWAG